MWKHIYLAKCKYNVQIQSDSSVVDQMTHIGPKEEHEEQRVIPCLSMIKSTEVEMWEGQHRMNQNESAGSYSPSCSLIHEPHSKNHRC